MGTYLKFKFKTLSKSDLDIQIPEDIRVHTFLIHLAIANIGHFSEIFPSLPQTHHTFPSNHS